MARALQREEDRAHAQQRMLERQDAALARHMARATIPTTTSDADVAITMAQQERVAQDVADAQLARLLQQGHETTHVSIPALHRVQEQIDDMRQHLHAHYRHVRAHSARLHTTHPRVRHHAHAHAHADASLDIDAMSYDDLLALGDRMGQVKSAGVSDAMIQRLPTSVYVREERMMTLKERVAARMAGKDGKQEQEKEEEEER